MSDFGETVSQTAAIASITNRYPLSVGLLRETVQNSDDAKASEQVFILDHNTYKNEPPMKIADVQGPALLAYNDATFSDTDWQSLQTISESAKRTDESKMGKYGLGFRANYHLTDNPQVLSGEYLAIFDPHCHFIQSGGCKLNIKQDYARYPDQFLPFERFLKGNHEGPFNGTVVRLPLRGDSRPSRISTKKPRPDEVRQLLLDFIEQEIKDVMLFLSHLSSIEIREIDDEGEHLLGKAFLKRAPHQQYEWAGYTCTTRQSTITIECFLEDGTSKVSETHQWHILRIPFSLDDGIEALRTRLSYPRDDYDVKSVLASEKLRPEVAIAVELPLSSASYGRLFTFLPLPVSTGFPCHIHALFSLADSRQNLRNCSEAGMMDCTADKTLTVWNELLFDTYIPMAWAALLRNLAGVVPDIYSVLPLIQHVSTSGESMYWSTVAQNVLAVIMDNKLPIWPLINDAAAVQSRSVSLDNVLVAAQIVEPHQLVALVEAGVQMIQPPPYVAEIIIERFPALALSPQTARHAMLKSRSLHMLSPASKNLVLDYLFSASDDSDLSTLADLPLFPVTSGGFVSLNTNSADTHVLFDEEEANLFGLFDLTALKLHRIPAHVATALRSHGHDVLNVRRLDSSTIEKYLASDEVNLEMSCSTIRGSFLEWLVDFWKWLGAWPLAYSLFPHIESLALLPTTTHHLQRPRSGIFIQSVGLEAPLRDVLVRIGIPFLHPSMHNDAVQFLTARRVSRSIMRAEEILDSLGGSDIILDERAAGYLRKHMSSRLKFSDSLTDLQRSNLYSLPIFPVLLSEESSEGFVTVSKSSTLPSGRRIYCVGGPSLLLPIVQDIVFLDRSNSGHELTHIDHNELHSDADVFRLLVDRFIAQPPLLQLQFLQCLAAASPNSRLSYPDTVHKLKNTPFIPEKGHFVAPKDIVDSQSPIADLYLPEELSPLSRCEISSQMISALRSLQLLCDRLSLEVVRERIMFISQVGRGAAIEKIALKLLKSLDETLFDCSSLRDEVQFLDWLPTATHGLRSPRDCRDLGDSPLCGRVRPLLVFVIQSTSLRKLLGWDRPIELDILAEQLGAILSEADCTDLVEYITAILHEYGGRVGEIDAGNMDELRRATLDRSWIPVLNKQLEVKLAKTSEAVFSLSNPKLEDFYQIIPQLASNSGIRQFLLSVGCTERPTNSALLSSLRVLQNGKLDDLSVKKAVNILRALQMETLTAEESGRLLVPDLHLDLRRPDQLCYNDVDDAPVRTWSAFPPDTYIMHGKVGISLAQTLGIRSLRSLHLDSLLTGGDDTDDEDMGEDLPTRIRGVLLSYHVKQSFTEFVANAADAGAREVQFLVDDELHRADANDLMSPSTMAEIVSRPSFVIHNDSVFQEDDFKGIRRVGHGMKHDSPDEHDSPDVIGKFGLGKLTMFHFTELPMIISGSNVVFLDPSRKYLPPDLNRNFLKLSLRDMIRSFRGHLIHLEGLFDFSFASDFYDGTLFSLPLRSPKQAKGSLLSQNAYSAKDMGDLLREYEEVAAQSLSFTQINKIEAFDRKSCIPSWSTSSSRQQKGSKNDDFHWQWETLTVTRDHNQSHHKDDWQVVSRRFSVKDLPSKFHHLIASHRLQSISIALAGLISDPTATQRNFFSTLPLPLLTSLPVHVHASFILADDRRSIRFDGDGKLNSESEYNHWLLSDLIPPLYLCLLESWPVQHASKQITGLEIWPGNSPHPDSLSRVVVDSFYHHLASSRRRVCTNILGDRITPLESVCLGREPESVAKVLRILKPSALVVLPDRAFESGIRFVNADFVYEVISHSIELFKVSYSRECIGMDDIEQTIGFILDGETPKKLLGLPLLPLANGQLAVIEKPEGMLIFAGEWPSGQPPPWFIFPDDRFLDPSIQYQRLLDGGYNVARLTGPATVDLIDQCLPSWKSSDSSSGDMRMIFWTLFDALGVQRKDISKFPLIPTIEDDVYISLDQYDTASVLSCPTESWLSTVLQRLGAIIVRKDRHTYPPLLREQLQDKTFTFSSVLDFLCTRAGQPEPLARVISKRLSPEDLCSFAEWVRQELSRGSHHNPIILHLPIWPAMNTRSVNPAPRAISDADVKIVPHHCIVSRIARFLTPKLLFADIPAYVVRALDFQPIRLIDFMQYLHLPRSLRDSDIPDFRQLLDIIVHWACNEPYTCKTIQVPNADGVFVQSNTLYASLVPEFQAAFHRFYFLHPLLRDQYESRLFQFGIHQDMDFATFKECVRAIHEDQCAPDCVDRAAILVRRYYQLPIQIGSNEYQWRQLDEFSFVPRDDMRRSGTGSFLSQNYARPLPRVVSPSKILRPKYEAIAWTQRALFLNPPPDDRIFLAHLSLGVPSLEEVVNHLRVLALKIAIDHDSNADVLRDLEATYEWLDERNEDIGNMLLAYRDDALFLNVDEPRDTAWEFCPASHLIFGAPDEETRRGVRGFLKKLSKLLIAAGALEVKCPEAPCIALSPAEDVLSRFRLAMNNLRVKRLLTDVVFTHTDGEIHAHRNILAAHSDHFRKMFCGDFAEASSSSVTVKLDNNMSFIYAEWTIDHIYTGQFHETQDQEELLGALELAHYWSILDLHHEVQRRLIGTITPGSYGELRENATRFEAEVLLARCVEFEQENFDALRQIRAMG